MKSINGIKNKDYLKLLLNKINKKKLFCFWMKRRSIISGVCLVALMLSITLVTALSSASTTVVVDIISSSNSIEIEVPEEINFGELSSGKRISETLKIYVNNTGSSSITVTPELDGRDEYGIFENLFLQLRKTGASSTLYGIGEFEFDIAAPGTSGVRSEYFWMKLDLSEFDFSEIDEDLLNYESQIVFYAVAN